MANRIQLRRDHSANWTRINPVLSDGEPGLEIDTNKVKYGDGTTAWKDLAYASGGATSSDRLVNGESQAVLASDGALLLSNLIEWPDADGGFQAGSKAWILHQDGSLRLPLGGTVKETQFVSGGGIGGADLHGTIVLTPNGVYNPWNNLTIYNTAFNPETQHIHLASGDLNRTEIVLGDDNKFVKVNLDGSVCVQSSPYYLYNLAGTSGGSSTVISHTNLNNIVSVGDYIIDAHGNTYEITGVTGTDPNWTISTNWASLTPLLASPYSFSKPNNTGGLWQFGADGGLTFPLGDGIFDRPGIDTGFNIRSNNASSPIYLYTYGTDGDGTGAGNIYINPTDVEIYSNWQNGGAGEEKWTFGSDGKLTFPNYSTFDGQTLTDYITGTNYTLKIANGGASGSKFAIGTGSNDFGIANDALNHAENGYVNYTLTAGRINLVVPGAGGWVFYSDGMLQLPTNGVIASTPGYVGSGVPIEDISRGTSTQLQVNGHGLSEGDKVAVNTITSTTQLNNNVYYVHVVDANNITLFTDPALTASVDSTAYTAYSYNGARTVVNPSVTYSTDTPFYTYSNPSYSGNSNSGGTNNIDFNQSLNPDMINVKSGWTYTSNHGETGTVTADASSYLGIVIRIQVSGPHSVQAGGSYTFTGVVATPIGGSMLFNGTTSVLQVKNDSAFAPSATTPWTLEFWAKYTTTLNQGATLFSIGAAASPMFALRVGGSNLMEIVLNGSVYSTGTYGNANYGPFGPNDWRHVAIVNDGDGTLSVFYSGYRLALETPVSFTYDSLKTFAIGGSSADGTFGTGGSESSSHFPGLITDFRFVVGTAVYDPTQGPLTVPTAPLDTTPSTTELYIPATDSSHFAQDTTTTEAHTGGGQVLKEFASADLVLEVGAVSQEDPGHVVLKSGSNQLKWGGASGVLTFPDGTTQKSGYGSIYTGWFRNPSTVVTLDNITAQITSDGIMQIGTVYKEDNSTGTAWAWNGIRNKGATYSSFGQGGQNWVLPGNWLNISDTPLDNDFEVATVSVFGLGDGHLYRIIYVGCTNYRWSVAIERVA